MRFAASIILCSSLFRSSALTSISDRYLVIILDIRLNKNEDIKPNSTIKGITHIIQKYKSILTNNATAVPTKDASKGLGSVTTIL